MSFPTYEDYKDSGVAWLGEIPSHWSVKDLKYACSHWPSNVDKKTVDGEVPVSLCNYTDVYYNETITRDLPFMQATASPEQIERFTLRTGDVIITKDSETADDIAVAAYVSNDLPGVVCGYHLAMIRPRESACGLFIKRLFDSSFVRAKVATLANGLTRVGLNHSAIGGLELPIPPPDEQEAIAAFLDAETAKIDTLVAEQRRLIELLQERRQAVISHAVTKGLHPDAPLKPSGIQWLGDVPEHWDVKRLKHLTPQVTVGIVVEPSKLYVEEGTPALRSLNIRQGEIDPSNLVYISRESNELHVKSRVRAGDLVAVRSGQPGTTAVVPAELDGCNCIDLIIIRKPTAGSEWFLCWFLASEAAIVQFSLGSGGAIQQHFNIGTAMQLIIPTPPESEQTEIADFLAAEAKRFDGLIANCELSIELLRERRSALISAAVTGKIDVRSLVPQEVA